MFRCSQSNHTQAPASGLATIRPVARPRMRYLSHSLRVLLCAIGLAACSSGPDTPEEPGALHQDAIARTPTASPSSCRGPGVTCQFDAQCCGASCDNGECGDDGSCRGPGVTCQFDAQCCGASCVNDECSDDGSCRGPGVTCQFDAQCCSDNCVSGECSDDGSCRGPGVTCQFDAQCCEGKCVSGRCDDATEADQRH
jgi:hypothetical protein